MSKTAGSKAIWVILQSYTEEMQSKTDTATTWKWLIQRFQKEMLLEWVIIEKKSILQNKLHSNPTSITLKLFSHPCFFNIQCWEGLSLEGEGGLVFSNPVRLLHSGIIYYRTKFSTLTVHCYWKEWQREIILVLCIVSVKCQHLLMWYSNSWDVFLQGRPQSCKQKGLFPHT